MVAVAPIGIKPPVEAVLQLGGMEATFEGQAEACGCSLDGDDPSLGGWDGLRGWAVGNHGLSALLAMEPMKKTKAGMANNGDHAVADAERRITPQSV
jgi:hypothetical protein